jgi:hypothetical protein
LPVGLRFRSLVSVNMAHTLPCNTMRRAPCLNQRKPLTSQQLAGTYPWHDHRDAHASAAPNTMPGKPRAERQKFVLQQPLTRFRYHDHLGTRRMASAARHGTGRFRAIDYAMKNSCLAIPQAASPRQVESTKKPAVTRAWVCLVPDPAGGCRTRNHSHSMVPGGLEVMS